MITVGADILDGSFEVDFSYDLLAPVGEEVRFRVTVVCLRRAGQQEILFVPWWLRPLIVAWLEESGDVYLAVARAEGRDIS